MLWSIDSCRNRVSADRYHLTVSRAQVSTHRGRVFFEVICWQVASFQMIASSSLFFLKIIWNMSCLCHYGPALLRFWFQKFGHKNSASYLKTQAENTFFIMDTRWSRSTSNLYALIGQNLTGEFTRKIYAVSWNLFTLIAQAGRVFCQLVMFFTVVSHWMHKMKYSC